MADAASFRAFLVANAAEVATWPEWKRKAYELRREPETSGVVTTTEAPCTVCGSTPVDGECRICALAERLEGARAHEPANRGRLVATNDPKILDGSPPPTPAPAADTPPRASPARVVGPLPESDRRHPRHEAFVRERWPERVTA